VLAVLIVELFFLFSEKKSIFAVLKIRNVGKRDNG
jgi:hypothetical protein